MRTGVFLLIVLVVSPIVASISPMDAGYEQGGSDRIIMVNIVTNVRADNTTENITNITAYPLVRMMLSDNSTLNFTSIDSLLYAIYNGSININEIVQINMTTIDQYTKYLNESTENETQEYNITYYPAYRLFFSRLLKPIANYSGEIVPVDTEAFIYNRYGEKYPRNPLYGYIGCFNVTYGEEEENILENDYDIFVLVYINITGADVVRDVEGALKQLKSAVSGNVLPIIIDTSNSFDYTNYSKEIDDLIIIHDNQTLISNSTNGTYMEFTTEPIPAIPLVIILDGTGLIWWKSFGLENIDELSTYINMYIDDRERSLPLYPILDVYPREPKANETCTIFIVLGDGFGEILEATLYYETLDSNNETINRKTVDVSTDTLSYTVHLDSSARWIVLNATITSEFGKVKSDRFIYKVQYEKKKKVIPSWFWSLLATVIVVVILGAVAIKIYRKYFA